MKIRERAENYGVDTLNNKELVQLLTGIEFDQNIQSLNDLRDKIAMLNGTKLQKLKLKSLFSFTTRINNERTCKTKVMNARETANIVMEDLRYLKKEHFKTILLNKKNSIIKISEIVVGSLDNASVHPREAFKEAIITSASAVILVHNHPSGETEPSYEDITLTNRFYECGKLLGIDVLDHIIIGDGIYYSFQEDGLL